MAEQLGTQAAVVSPVNVQEFAKKVKEKYPEYKDVDDLTLAQKIVEKYPEYKDRVQFEPTETNENELQQPSYVEQRLIDEGHLKPAKPQKPEISATESLHSSLPYVNVDKAQVVPSIQESKKQVSFDQAASPVVGQEKTVQQVIPQQQTKQEEYFQPAAENANISSLPEEQKLTKEEEGFWSTWLGDAMQGFSGTSIDILGNIAAAKTLPMRSYLNYKAKSEGMPDVERKVFIDSFLQNNPETAPFETTKINAKQEAERLSQASDRYNGKDFAKQWEEGNYGAVAGDIFLQGAKSLPYMIMAMGGGAGGLGAIGLTSGTGKYEELDNPQLPELFTEKEKADFISKLNMSEFQKLTNSALSGTSEAASELLGSVPMGKYIGSLIAKVGKPAAQEIIQKGVSGWIQKMFNRYGLLLGPAGEGIEEVANSLATDAIDLATGATTSLNANEMVSKAAKSFVYGMGGGAFGSAGAVGVMAYDKITRQKPITTATIEGQQYTINNPEDLGQEGKPIFAKDANGNIIPVPNHKVTNPVTQTVEQIDQANQQEAERIKLYEGIADPNAQIINEVEDNGARFIDFSNGQTKIIFNGQEVIANDINEKDRILESIVKDNQLPEPKATDTGEVISPEPEKKVITQKFGNTPIDIIENEGYDEIVPSEKMPLDKALPVLEKKFKDNPKFQLQVEKVQVEEPGETKYDDPVKKTVIKSIRIVPKVLENANIENKNVENVSETQNQQTEQQQIVNQEQPESLQKNQLQNEEFKNVSGSVAGAAPQTEDAPQAQQGQGINEGLEENVIPEMDGFDWNDLNAAIEDAYANKLSGQELIDQQREEAYQASRFSKKWAKTYKEAVQKTIEEYKKAKSDLDKWQSKEYKKAKGKTVEVGDELDGGTYSVDYINEQRKAKNIRSAQFSMKEAIEDLKALGLTKEEISSITDVAVPPVVGESFTPGDSAGQITEKQITEQEKINAKKARQQAKQVSPEEQKQRSINKAKALSIEPSTIEQLVLQYIVAGNRLNWDEIKREVFPRSDSEMKQRIWMLKKDAKTIDQLLGLLNGTPMEEEGNQPNAFRNAVIDAVLRNGTRTQMVDRILEIGDQNNNQQNIADYEQRMAEAAEAFEQEERNNELLAWEEYLTELENNGQLPTENQLIELFLQDNTTTNEQTVNQTGGIEPDGPVNPEENEGNGQVISGSKPGNDGRNAIKESQKELTPLEKEIQSLQKERAELLSKKVKTVKNVNARNGLFGDIAAQPNDLFAGQGFDATEAQRIIKSIDDRISVIDQTIENLSAKNEQIKATAEKENAGQQELVIPEKPDTRYGSTDEWANWILIAPRNEVSFPDFKRAITNEWVDSQKSVIEYFFKGNSIGKFNTDIDGTGIRGWYNNWVDGKVNLPDRTLEAKQVQDVAGQDSGQHPAVKSDFIKRAEEIISGSEGRRLADLSDLISKSTNISELGELLSIPFVKSNMDLPKDIRNRINYLERHPEKQTNNNAQFRTSYKSYIQETIDELQAKAPSAAPVVVVQSLNDVPSVVRNSSGFSSKVEAFYYAGKVYIFPDMIKSRDHLINIWIHENGIHHGIKNIVSFRDMRLFMNKIYDSFRQVAKNNAEFQSIVDRISQDYPNATKQEMADEYLAYLAEKKVSESDLSPMEQTLWQKYLDMFRDFLRRLFNFDSNLLTEKQIIEITRFAVQSNFQQNELAGSNTRNGGGIRQRTSSDVNGSEGSTIESAGIQDKADTGRTSDVRSRRVLDRNSEGLTISDQASEDLKNRHNALDAITRIGTELNIPVHVVNSSELTSDNDQLVFTDNGTVTIVSDRVKSVSEVIKALVKEVATTEGLREMLASADPNSIIGKQLAKFDELPDGKIEPEKLAQIIRKAFRLTSGQFTNEDLIDAIVNQKSDVSGNVQFRVSNNSEDNNLIAVHNIKPGGLLNANRLGGLPMPSLAIVDVNNGFDKYGDITLVADKDFIDPKKNRYAKVFAADVYSARYPNINYQIPRSRENKIVNKVNSLFEDKSLASDISHHIKSEIEDGGLRNLSRDQYAQLLFLADTKRPFEVKYSESKVSDDAKQAFKDNGWLGLMYHEIHENNQVKKQLTDLYMKKYESDPDLMNIARERFVDEDGMLNSNLLRNFIRDVQDDIQKTGKVDTYSTVRAADEYIRNNNLQDEFEAYAANLYDQIGVEEKIFRGFSNSGNRLYSPHTLENVLKEMKKDGIRGGEKFGYGAGNVRAQVTPEFKSLPEIQKNRGRIMPFEDDIKSAANDELIEVMDNLKKFYKYESGSFGYYDNASEELVQLARSGRSESFKPIDEESRKMVSDFLNKLAKMPTEYFEAKINRGVSLAEFKNALIPSNTSPEIRDILKFNGINAVEYQDNADRTEKLKQLADEKDLRFRIIGETGAANLDKAEEATIRLDNLAIAREMEQAGKDVKSIRLATGWEKGVDGKWRYEVPDGKLKQDKFPFEELQSFDTKGRLIFTDHAPRKYKLSEIIDDPELFKAYPELEDLHVEFNNSNIKANGAYVNNSEGLLPKGIYLNNLDLVNENKDWNDDFTKKYLIATDDTKSTLVHEIQHAIQEIEGFARGGMDTGQIDVAQILQQNQRDFWDGKISFEEKYKRDVAAQQANNPKDTFKRYQSLAGEVESRNVQTRMNMTPEERLNTLLSETEDVSREDQIVLMDGLGVSNLEEQIPETITVNGVERPTRNSKGQFIHTTKEGIENFWKWFGDSKVVDEEGRPLVVYHGTRDNFNEFIPTKGINGKLLNRGTASWFSPHAEVGRNYAGSTGSVIEAYIKITNPKIAKSYIEIGTINSDKIAEYKSEDYDGAYFNPDLSNKFLSKENEEYVTFNPSQIKSATGNDGSFSPETNDIRFRIADELPKGIKKVGTFKTDEGKFSYYDIEFAPRGRAQYFTVLEDKKGWIVRNVILPESERGKGIAINTYRYLNQQSINKTGNPLRSSRPRTLNSGETIIELSNDGVKLWENLVKAGDAIKTGEKQYEFLPNDHVRYRIEQERENVNTEPSDAQKEADNYKMGHIRFDGFDISIENPKGSVRSGVDKQGNEWSQVLPADYGYFRGTVGKDKDHVDVFIGNKPEASNIYIIDQIDPNSGKFDEHKVMLGFDSQAKAKQTYLAAFEPGWKGLGKITKTDKQGLKEWFEKGDQKKPFSDNVVRFRILGDPRSGLTNIRGSWTKAKIIKELKEIKKTNTSYGKFGLLKGIASFENAQDLRNHLFYHGTGGGVSGALYPSITMSEREAERNGGGGYGQRYFAISVSKSKRKAASFSGQSRSVSVYPVILNKEANVIDRPDLNDSNELDDIIEELWNDKVDAVRLGDWSDLHSEQELAVINPNAISTWSGSDSRMVYGMKLSDFTEKTDEELENIIDKAKSALIKMAEWEENNKRPVMPEMIEYNLNDPHETVAEAQAKNKQIISERKRIREEYNQLKQAEQRKLADNIRFRIQPRDERIDQLREDLSKVSRFRTASENDLLKSVNETVESNMNESYGIKQTPLWERIKKKLSEVKESTQHFKYITEKDFPEVYDKLRQFEAIPDRVKKEAFERVSQIVRPLIKNEEHMRAFERYIVLSDLVHDIEETDLFAGKELPWGYNTVDEIKQDMRNVRAYVMRTPQVLKAIRDRQAMMREVKKQLVDSKLLKDNGNNNYFHHQVLAFMEGRANVGVSAKDVRNHKKGWQRSRQGSIALYNTNYVESEFEVMAQSLEQLAIKDMLGEINQSINIMPQLIEKAQKEGGKWRDYIPDGYKFWFPKPGTNAYKAASMAEKAVQNMMNDPENPELQAILAEAEGSMWVIPEPVAKQLDEMKDREKEMVYAEALRAMTGKWKQWTLLNPFRAAKYNFNNLSGDLDIVLAYNPKILEKKYAHAAMTEALNELRGLGMSPDMKESLKYGVITSGLSIQEIPDINKQSLFRSVTKGQGTWAKRMFGKTLGSYWSGVTAFTQFRENILRVAAYKFFKDQIKQGKQPIGVSKIDAIQALYASKANANEIAGKLARELMGDYGNLSQGGQWIRAHSYPFWSWVEVNAPRYYRLLQNTKFEGNSGVIGRVAGVGAKKTAVNVGMLGVRAMLMMGLVVLWNNIFFPDEDDELQKLGDDKLKLIVGRREDGSIITIKIQGAFSDVLSFFSLEDAVSDVKELKEGKTTAGKKLAESGNAFVNKFAQGAMPLTRASMELAMGKTLYPDIFDPRVIRDRGEHAARLVSMDKLYNYLTHKPVRSFGKEVSGLLVYDNNPGEAAYYTMREKINEFLKDNDEDGPAMEPSDKSNALYYYKKSLKMGDQKAAKFWFDKYRELGGTAQGYKTSMKKGMLMNAVPKDLRAKWFDSLDAEDKEILDLANRWYLETYLKVGIPVNTNE